MSELIDKDAFLKQERKWYCENCDRRKGVKNGRKCFVYEIGEVPCRACDVDDVLDDLEDFPTASPWHRVEEKPKDGQECIVAYLGPTDWIYEYATYHIDLNKALEEDIFIEGTDGFIVDGDIGYARHGSFKYWMPIEPPQEDA